MEPQNSNKAGLKQQGSQDLDRLSKPLRLELKQGCLDKAVSGGLAAYVRRWDSQLAPVFAAYGALRGAERKAVVESALKTLAAR